MNLKLTYYLDVGCDLLRKATWFGGLMSVYEQQVVEEYCLVKNKRTTSLTDKRLEICHAVGESRKGHYMHVYSFICECKDAIIKICVNVYINVRVRICTIGRARTCAHAYMYTHTCIHKRAY